MAALSVDSTFSVEDTRGISGPVSIGVREHSSGVEAFIPLAFYFLSSSHLVH